MKADFVIDFSFGDCGKGKVSHHLLKDGGYTHCIRYNGSSNAGHTIYHHGKKLVTHLIPAGVFFGVKSIVGPGCVLNVKKFFDEINYLEDNGINARSLVKISKNTHIVTDAHLQEEIGETAIGTTKSGVGPAYRDKYARSGIRAESIPELKPFLVDFHEEVFSNPNNLLLMEGAQGMGLDIDHGDYPYVTSSACGVAGALQNGIPYTAVRNVFGVIKGYETYVGAKQFENPEDPVLPKLRELGNEFGATTGRPRQCNYLCISSLTKAIQMNGLTTLVVNKMDILKQLNVWKVRFKDQAILDVTDESAFKTLLEIYVHDIAPEADVKFSYSPEHI